MSRDEVKTLGFKEHDKPTLLRSLFYPLERNRFLSIGSLGTPNEMLFIADSFQYPENIIVLHNYDYDGYLTSCKLEGLLEFFKKEQKEIK